MPGSSSKGQSAAHEPGMIAQWRSNRGGFAGLLLSIVQLLMHGLWIGITEILTARGELANVTSSSWQAWLIVAGQC